MSLTLDKATIAANFSRAARNYNAWAAAHRAIAARLAGLIPGDCAARHILDLGCGTGLLAEQLRRRFPAAQIRGLDLAAGMVEACRARWADDAHMGFEQGDFERLRPERPPDLIASSCALFWAADRRAALRGWRAALCAGGWLALAELVAGSLPELAESFRHALDAEPAGPAFPDWTEECGGLAEAGFSVRRAVCEAVTLQHADALAALRSFKELGAVFTAQPGHRPLSASQARRLAATYAARFAGASGAVPLTFRIGYYVARASNGGPAP